MFGSPHLTMGGHGALTHTTSSSEQVWPAEHPPLSRSHDGLQNVSPVGSYTSHLDPVGHSFSAQGSVEAHTLIMHLIIALLHLVPNQY